MIIKAIGRSALILATGLFVCFAGPLQAAGAEDSAVSATSEAAAAPLALHKYARHGSHHWKKYVHRGSGKVAPKPSPDNKASAADDGDRSSAITPSVANAKAQLMSADTPTGDTTKAVPARANGILQTAPDKPAEALPAADGQVVSADQLNDVDRALREDPPPASMPPMALASTEAPAAPSAPGAASSSENSAWEQTSLIGKVFIGFGALLTMASAARMFMA